MRQAFRSLKKKALMMVPALGLPDLSKPFELFVYERQHRFGSIGPEDRVLEETGRVLL